MPGQKIQAVFVRGGTSKGVFFHERDLPADPAARDEIILNVLGSPDPYQRQLNGMGGGISSLSKAVIIDKSRHSGADVDYTFAQVAVDQPVVDFSGTCGNLSSAVGPFAVDEGLVTVADGDACVRVYSTNSDKIYHAHFEVNDGQAVEDGGFTIPGVAGSGARVTLDYLDPGGALTGKLLPSGAVRDTITIDGLGDVDVSLVDATNAVIFVAADDLGYTATEHPDALDADPLFMGRMDEIRRKGAVLMGMANRPEDAPLAAPKVGMVGPPQPFEALDGTSYGPEDQDLTVRMVSMERVHRAVPGTNVMGIAAAARIGGTIPHELATKGKPLRVANPSGVIPVDSDVIQRPDGAWHVNTISVYRTQRRLMEGCVLIPDQERESETVV